MWVLIVVGIEVLVLLIGIPVWLCWRELTGRK